LLASLLLLLSLLFLLLLSMSIPAVERAFAVAAFSSAVDVLSDSGVFNVSGHW
jgi:hypothetical protein